jgi:hypothetical protein
MGVGAGGLHQLIVLLLVQPSISFRIVWRDLEIHAGQCHPAFDTLAVIHYRRLS